MSSFRAKVIDIQNCDALHIVKFDFNSQELSMISLELSCDIKIGTQVKLAIKPTNIIISKEAEAITCGIISCDNILKSKIVDIENGKLLSSVKLAIKDEILESIITYNSSKQMGLKVGDSVMALIQSCDLSISEVL
jgi:molybdopterin-binding protein